jgi:hypothetical protein
LPQQNNVIQLAKCQNEIQYNEHNDTKLSFERKQRKIGKEVEREILYHGPQIESKLWCFNGRELGEDVLTTYF